MIPPATEIAGEVVPKLNEAMPFPVNATLLYDISPATLKSPPLQEMADVAEPDAVKIVPTTVPNVCSSGEDVILKVVAAPEMEMVALKRPLLT